MYQRVFGLSRALGAPVGLALIVALTLAAPAAALPPTVTTSSAVGSSVQIRVIGQFPSGYAGDTSYHIEYGPTAAYGSATPVTVVPDPTPNSGAQMQYSVDQTFAASPASTYHLRLVATNADGTGASDDRTVQTLAAGTGAFNFALHVAGPRDWSRGDNWRRDGVAYQPGRVNNEQVGSLTISGDATNDVTGLTTGSLALSSSTLTGNAFTLGAGGLTSSSSSNVMAPVQLSADQTWNVGSAEQPWAGHTLTSSGGLTGGDASLTVKVATGSRMTLLGANEVGEVTVGGAALKAPLTLGAGATLNAANGNPVKVAGGMLVSEGGSIGVLQTGDAATVQVGRPTDHPTGSLATTSATLSPGATLGFEVGSGFDTQPGTGFGQLSSSGSVDLADAKLQITHRAGPANAMPPLCENAYDGVGVGTVYTLLSTAGGLTGKFANAPDGSILADSCGALAKWTINYTANAVTATVAPAERVNGPPNPTPTTIGELHIPKILGLPANGGATGFGAPLTVRHASWLESVTKATNKQGGGETFDRPVTSISVQWEDCGTYRIPPGTAPVYALNTGCVPIPGATGTTYTPRAEDFRIPWASDLFHHLAVRETATGSTGLPSTRSAESTKAMVVELKTYPTGPTFPGGGSENQQFFPAIVKALNAAGPPAKKTTIRSLLKKGLASVTFEAPLPGKLAVAWYHDPAGALLPTTAAKKKPLLVAIGTKTVAKAGKVTLVVKLTKAGKKKLRASKKTLPMTSKASFVFGPDSEVINRFTAFKLKR